MLIKEIAMNKSKQKILLVALFLIVVSFVFYWVEIRPSIIRKSCASWSLDQARKSWGYNDGDYDPKDYNKFFKTCTDEKGL